jgi:hypothetical protein
MHNRSRGNDHTKRRLARAHQPNPPFPVAERGEDPNRRQHDDHLPITSVDASRPPPGKDGGEKSEHSSSQDQPPAQRQDLLAPRPALKAHHPLVHDKPDASARAGVPSREPSTTSSPCRLRFRLTPASLAPQRRSFLGAGYSFARFRPPGHTESSTPPPAPGPCSSEKAGSRFLTWVRDYYASSVSIEPRRIQHFGIALSRNTVELPWASRAPDLR